MARYAGVIGYGETIETEPGYYEEQITERRCVGDVIRDTRTISSTDKVNPDISVGNSISIVADAYATEHFFSMRYITWMGQRWTVTEVEVQRPRLILRLGGLYHASS